MTTVPQRRPNSDKVLLTGHLYKQGGSYRNWNRRYFILRPSTLSYFSSEGDKNPKGVIDLTKGRGVRTKDQCKLRSEEWPRAATQNVSFGLAIEDRTFYLYGCDKAAVDDWMTILQERIQEVGTPRENNCEDCVTKPERVSSKILRGGARLANLTSRQIIKVPEDANEKVKGKQSTSEQLAETVDNQGEEKTRQNKEEIQTS